jgi:hypothetical protein
MRPSITGALAAILAGVPGLQVGSVESKSETVQQRSLRQAMQPGGAGVVARRRGPGWTQAHVKRLAKKRRNVLRNRRAHRG